MKSMVLIIALLFTIQPVYAYTVGKNLSKLPSNLIPDADREAMRDAIAQALEQQADGKTTKWTNPETGNSGMIRTTGTHTQDGMTCRKLLLRNHIADGTNDWAFTFCKTPEGIWKIGPSK